ncbi:MAG TPA: hypothetical protein VHA33_29245 [Candidatus Angelobacter sp.]|jgi:hypothetical protein|nr:hypothetical protein [Candidatus Angelobacter sp.]
MRLALLWVMALSLMKGCKAGSPEQVSQEFQAGLRPYFPNSQVLVSPEQQAIIGITCLRGAGKQLIDSIASEISQNADINKLRDLRDFGPLLGNPSYKYVLLAFDTGAIRLNVDTWRTDRLAATPQYTAAFNTSCPQDISVQPTQPNAPYIWVGYWTLKLSKPANGRTEIQWVDSLGIYGSMSDFYDHRDSEVRAREQLIREYAAGSKWELSTIRLDSIKPVRFSQNPN